MLDPYQNIDQSRFDPHGRFQLKPESKHTYCLYTKVRQFQMKDFIESSFN